VDGSIIEYFAIECDDSFTTEEVTTLAGVITGRSVTADGPKLDILTLDEDDNPIEVSYIVAMDLTDVSDTIIAAYDDDYDPSSDLTDLDLGQYVTFAVEGFYFKSIDEVLPEDLDPDAEVAYSALVAGFDDETLIIEVQDSLEDPTWDPTPEYILNVNCLVFDVTDEAVLVGFEDIEVGQTIMLIDLPTADELIDVVLIVEK